MKIIKPEVKKISQEPGLEGIYKAIADAAKICYQTEKTKKTDEEFVEMLIKNKHNRPLEMGTVYLKMPIYHPVAQFLKNNAYSKYVINYKESENILYITTNYRVLVEWLPNMTIKTELERYLIEPCEFTFQRHTFDFILSRGAADDFRTHVTLSSIMESSRFNSYDKDKFGNELTFIEPYWEYTNEDLEDWQAMERIYMKKMSKGYQPQQAKNFLPLGIKTQLRMCGFKDAWENFIEKRDSPKAYPECQALANVVKSYF